jgi:hypothetical protein
MTIREGAGKRPLGLVALLLFAAPTLTGSAQLAGGSSLRHAQRGGGGVPNSAVDDTAYFQKNALYWTPWGGDLDRFRADAAASPEGLLEFQRSSHAGASTAHQTEEPKVEIYGGEGAMNTVYVALTLFFVPALTAIFLTYWMPPMLKKDSVMRRYYGYLFFAHRNQAFADDFELSMRGTVGVLILAIPYMTPTFHDMVHSGYYSSLAVLLFVFTLYKTTGDTINLAFEGILGTLLAVLNIWVLQGVFPQGVTQTSSDLVGWTAVIDGVVFILVVVGSDLDKGCKMFALNWHCYFWMDFLNPNVTGAYSSNWKIDIRGPAISGLVQSMIGVGVAVLVSLLPFPLFALDKARNVSLTVADELSEAWDLAISCFTNPVKDNLNETKLRHDIDSIEGHVGSMGGYAGIAWWECLGLPGRPQRVRDLCVELSSSARESYNRLVGLRHLCRVVKRGPEHAELMEHLKPYLENLSKQTGDLFKALTDGAVDGSFDEDEKARIADLKAKVVEAMSALTQEYQKKSSTLKVDLFHQASFCLAYCSYARFALEYEQVMQKNVGTYAGLFIDNVKGWFKKFNIPLLTDPLALNCWVRSSASILACFFVGYNGYSAILPGYNATPAATVSLLLSSGLTAQPASNLARFEGVVLGIVFGQIAYALFGWCSLSGYIGVGTFLVLWCIPTFILYYHTTDFLLLGCLLAAFGVVGVLRGCSDSVFEAGGSYNTVVGVVVAITIKVFVDSFAARSRASDEATNTLVSAWAQLEQAMKDFFDPAVEVINFKAAAIKGTFQAAAALSKDADSEPRLWWCSWKGDLFVGVCKSGYKICEALSNLESAFSKTGCDGGPKSSTAVNIQEITSSGKVKEDLLMHIACMKNLCNEAFSYNKDGFFASEYEVPKGLCNFITLNKGVGELSMSLTKANFPSYSTPEQVASSLEYDAKCKISTLYFTVEWMVEVLEDLNLQILSQ